MSWVGLGSTRFGLSGRSRPPVFKTRIGLDVCETSRDVSFCAHAILQDDILVVLDATTDPRFASNPLVLGPPFIRFYAGKPLKTPGGAKVGTVCLIDSKPWTAFTAEDRSNLADIAALVQDRMETRRLEYARQVSQARFENIAATSPDAIVCVDAQGRVTFWNRSAELLFGHSAEEMLDRTSSIIVPRSWRHLYDAELSRLRAGETLQLAGRTILLSGLRRDGIEFPAEFSLSTWDEAGGTSVGAIVRDVTERRQNEERLLRLATRDALTNLRNRAAWRDVLERTLQSEGTATVLLLDLDGFKEVNDTFGHSAGDAVLKSVARRLRAALGTSATVARLGGDEFVALLPGNDERRAKMAVSTVMSEMSRSHEISGRSVTVGASIGVALAPQHGARTEELLGSADLALYRAKASGKGRCEFFAPALRQVAVARRAFEEELRRAFDDNEFEIFYQPQVSTGDRRVIGAEALMRWNHPERGLLTPATFMEVLSQKPSAAAIGDWVLRTAARQGAAWREQIPNFRMAVNLFEAQLRTTELLATVRTLLREQETPPLSLELELVETIFLRSDPTTLQLLADLRALGVGLAFDDYGTGYASLSLLKRYPVSRLKIDRSFIRNVNTNAEDAAIVKAVLYLGRSFGLEVIAEGVETEEQLDFLLRNQCQEAQGYLFGRPIPAIEFSDRFIKERSLAVK